MKNSEDTFQERLEKLEAGEPLTTCQAGLPSEEAELLQLAAQLQQIETPVPAAAHVAAQRAELLAATPPPALNNQMEETGFWALLTSFFNTPTRMAGAAVFAVLVLIAIGLWANRPSGTPQLTQTIDKETAVFIDSPEEESPISAASGTTELGEAVSALSDSGLPGSQTFLPILSTSLPSGPHLATLIDIQGLVEIKETDGAWQTVVNSDALAAGTHIRTNSLSSAKLVFYDNSVATLGPQTELTLEKLDAQPAEVGYRTVVLKQMKGESDHAVQFRNDGGSRYEVLTPDGSGIARGTKFNVTVTPEQFSRIAVTEGRVDVTGSNRTVSVTPGKLTTIPSNEQPTAPAFTITGQGVVSEIGETWIIAGQTFVVNEATVISGDPQLGDTVFVEGHLSENGQTIADHITLVQHTFDNQFSLTGIVTEMNASHWIIAQQSIQLTSDTEIDDEIEIDDTVHVFGEITPDGMLTAVSIERVPEEEGYPFDFTGIVQQINTENWLVSGVVITINEETAVPDAPQIGDIVRVRGLILEDQTWLASSIEVVDTTLATFSLSGEVQSIDPWQVAGIQFATSTSTFIDSNIAVGDSVQVLGRILPDGTWLADSIVLIDEDFLLEIVFAGTVDALAPWVVNGLPLDTNTDTIIDDGIEVGDLVRVTARILEDGTWLATRIDRLRGEVDEGCVSITAVVTNIGSGSITLSNGSQFNLDELEIEGTLKVGSVVVIVACVAEDGTIQIEDILILYTPEDNPPTPPPTDPGSGGGDGNVTICHKPGTPAEKTKTVSQSALNGHLGHGDTMGACP
jgi:hypothetical protein